MPKIEFFLSSGEVHGSQKGAMVVENKFNVGLDYPPQSAKNFIPEEYKNLINYRDNDLRRQTVKKCIPFLDALTGGYIIPFFQDYLITVDFERNSFDVNTTYGEVAPHASDQLPNNYQDRVKPIGKFNNKWAIKTPPGYSCLFMHPINTPKKDFEIISGVVDTDSFEDTILIPYYIRRHGGESEKRTHIHIKLGDSMVQVIPFKRESWTSSSKIKKEEKVGRFRRKWGGRLFDTYKKMYWHKKDYK